jgi:hypothetical protein
MRIKTAGKGRQKSRKTGISWEHLSIFYVFRAEASAFTGNRHCSDDWHSKHEEAFDGAAEREV